jgi:hypothetical protein
MGGEDRRRRRRPARRRVGPGRGLQRSSRRRDRRDARLRRRLLRRARGRGARGAARELAELRPTCSSRAGVRLGRYGYACARLGRPRRERGFRASPPCTRETRRRGGGRGVRRPDRRERRRDARRAARARRARLGAGSGRELGSAEEEGYLAAGSGGTTSPRRPAPSARRALLAKLGGETRTEVGGDWTASSRRRRSPISRTPRRARHGGGLRAPGESRPPAVRAARRAGSATTCGGGHACLGRGTSRCTAAST